VMRTGLASGIPDWLPALGLAEGLMGLPGRRGPLHCGDPVSHLRNCSSLLRLII
jgi:hypothetical protein